MDAEIPAAKIARVTDAFLEGEHAIVNVVDTDGKEHIFSFCAGDYIDPIAAFAEELCKQFQEAM